MATARPRSSLLLSAILGTLAAVCPATAAATVVTAGGLTYVSEGSTAGPGYFALTAPCPAGTHVLGGGEEAGAGYHGVALHHSFPVDGGDTDTRPDDGWTVQIDAAGAYAFTVHAICTERKVRYVEERFRAAGGARATRAVACPEDRNIAAGGERGGSVLRGVSGFPTATQKWRVAVDNLSDSRRRARAYAVCVGFPTTQQQQTVTVLATDQNGFSADCANTQHVVSGGVSTDVAYGKTAINSTYPYGGAAPDDGWFGFLDNLSGTARSVTVYGVCAPSL